MKLIYSAFILLAAVSAPAFAQTPVLSPGGVLNGASFAAGQPVTPGSLVSIFGTGLAATNTLGDSIPLSTSLAGVSVSFNGIPAPLSGVFHSPTFDQINAQVPWEVPNGPAQVVVTNASGTSSAPQSVQVAVAPGIFSTQGGVGQAIAYSNSNGLIAAAAGAIPGLATVPAKIGDPLSLVILATGLGPVNPPVPTGSNVTDGLVHNCVTPPTVLVGGVAAQVLFAGLQPQFVGVYQINIVIASGTPTGNAVPLQIQMNGMTTTNQVTIAVSN
ncbi:MAG: hypothetical protein ACLQU1_37550 [Bryobacteraceae bacterium]